MKNRNGQLNGHVSACHSVASRFHSRFHRSYVASKLRTDPVYPAVYKLIHASAEPVLDVGCGLGLLAFYLRERGFQNPILGLDRDSRKIREANRIARSLYNNLVFRDQDIQNLALSFSGSIILLDLLHYLSPINQRILLGRLGDRVANGALLILRDCPRDPGVRFWLTYLAEKFAQRISWNVATPLYFPSRKSIGENFSHSEFSSETKPLWGSTPFNNHLFVFRRYAGEVAPLAEQRSDSRAQPGHAA